MTGSDIAGSFLDRADWTFPIPVAYGPGRLAELGTHCAAAGMANPLVVTDRGSADLPFIATAIDSITGAGARVGLFAEVSPNPTDGDAGRGREAFRSGGHDGVVAIGGGSGMDGGKLISLIAGNDVDLWRFDFDADTAPELVVTDFVPLICVPTTAGTGAETESTAMITDREAGVKRCLWHEIHKPGLALLDPEVTVGLPVDLTAWTGIDALVHAIEAFVVPTLHPLCDGMALEAMRLISGSLLRAVEDGADLEARGAMLVASCMAGVSFLKGLGLVHAMSHMIGAIYDTHHGLTNAVLLPLVLEHNRGAMGHKPAAMCEAIGFDGRDHDGLVAGVVALLDRLEIPRSLAELGVDGGRVEELAAKTLGDAAAGTNPAPCAQDGVEAVLRQALVSAR